MSKLKSFLEREPLSQLIPVRAYESRSKIFYTEDDADSRYLSTVLLFAPTPGASEDIAEKLETLLRLDFPVKSMLSVMLIASQDISHSLESIMSERASSTDPLLVNAKRSEVAFYANGVRSPIEQLSKTTVREFQVIVSLKMALEHLPTDDDFSRVADYQSRLLTGFESAAGMRGVALDADQYIYMMKTIIDWSPNAGWKTDTILFDDSKFINEQIWEPYSKVKLDSEDENGFWLNDKRVMILSPKRLPKHFSLNLASSLISDVRTSQRGMRGNFAFCLNMYFPDTVSGKDTLERKRSWVNQQAFGPMLRLVPRIADYKNSYDALFKTLDGGDRLVQICPTWILFGDSKKECEDKAVAATQYLVELGYQIAVDEFTAFPLFINSLPLCADASVVAYSKRYHTVGTSHAVHFLPIGGDWRGTATPTMSFVSRNGQLMNVDLFDSSTNYNAVIAAASGSGKSFLANYLTGSYLSVNCQAWIIDVGRSYKKLCESLNGQFLAFDSNSNACLNPFPLINDYNEESDMIIGLLIAMMSPPEAIDHGLEAIQISRLKEYVKRLWEEHKQSLSIDYIAEALVDDEDQRISDLGKRLFPFTSVGEYGTYFNGENNIEFNNRLFVLELEELKGRPHLQQVVLLQLIYQIQQAVYLSEDKSQRKLVAIDEAWDLLKHGNVATFMEGAYRRFRKYNTSAIVITQALDDMSGSASGKAILANSANIMLLGQTPAKVHSMEDQKLLDLSPAGFDLLKTVATVKGHYSEIFFYLDNGNCAGVGRLIVDRRSQLLYTTQPDEVAALDKLQQAGLSLEEAIEEKIRQESYSNALAA